MGDRPYRDLDDPRLFGEDRLPWYPKTGRDDPRLSTGDPARQAAGSLYVIIAWRHWPHKTMRDTFQYHASKAAAREHVLPPGWARWPVCTGWARGKPILRYPVIE